MPKPVVLLVDDISAAASFESDLQGRCGGDFDVRRAASPADAGAILDRLQEENRPLALILVSDRLGDEPALELLAKAEAFPGARRIFYTNSNDPDAARAVTARTRVDACLVRPWEAPESSLYPVVREQLDAWRHTAPPVDVVRVIGYEWSSS